MQLHLNPYTPTRDTGGIAAKASTVADSSGTSMLSILAEAEQAAGIPGDELSPTEYRMYIVDQIAQIPVDPSQALSSHSVHISEAAFAAMQKDPEYEQWVLDGLRQNFAFKDPWTGLCGGSYHVHSFGATKEEYHGESWFPGYGGGLGDSMFQSRAAGSTWRRDTPKLSRSSSGSCMEDLESRLRAERMQRRIALERREYQSELLEQAAVHRKAAEDANRSGERNTTAASPVPQFHGVPAAVLLAVAGGQVG